MLESEILGALERALRSPLDGGGGDAFHGPSGKRTSRSGLWAEISGVRKLLSRTPGSEAVAYRGDDFAEFAAVLFGAAFEGRTVCVVEPIPFRLAAAASDLGGLLLFSGKPGGLGDSPFAVEPATGLAVSRIGEGAVGRARLLPTETGVVVYTSGSTGKPVGVATTLASYYWNVLDLLEALPLGSIGNVATSAPLFTSYGMSLGIFMPLIAGKTCVAIRDWQPSRLAARLANYPESALIASPAVFTGLCEERDCLRHAGHSLSLGISSGDSLSPRAGLVFSEHSRFGLFDSLGSTETNGIALSPPSNLGAFEPLASVRIKARSEHADPAGGQGGWLSVNSRKNMLGSIDEAGANSRPIEWVETRDWVRLSQDGTFRLVGRGAGMLKINGVRMHSQEIEAGLESVSGILEAYVVGIPDPLHGQVVKAFLRLEKGRCADEMAWRSAIADKLPPAMVPRIIRFVQSIPRQNGKKSRTLAAGHEGHSAEAGR